MTYNNNNHEELDPLLDEIRLLHDWSDESTRAFQSTLAQYCNYNQMTLQELLNEAEQEELESIPSKHRRIKKRLIGYQLHLQKSGRKYNTITAHISRIKTFYKYYEIPLPQLPRLKNKENKKLNNIPSHDDIKRVLLHTNTRNKALITFMASSGVSRNETANLTIQDFITSTVEYHNTPHDIYKALQTLEYSDHIIPTWEIHRQKTSKSYYSFSSNESSRYIIQMLRERRHKKRLYPDDRLFGVVPTTITTIYRRLNETLDFGVTETGGTFFHAHAMRSFFASVLFSEGLDYTSIEFMLGHSIGKVQEAYIMANPEKQKQKYVRLVDKVSFLENIQYQDISSVEKKELEMLKDYKTETEKRLRELERIQNLLTNDLLK